MSHDREKYLYFTVGLLKDSSTLDALWQDALKYHMIDQPGKLIALRLTEHYEMKAQESLHAGAGIPMTPMPKAVGNGHYQKSVTSANSTANNRADLMNDFHSNDESVIAASPDAEQNADEAAEYWAQL